MKTLTIERLDSYNFKVTGEGINATAEYWGRYDSLNRVKGKGSRNHKNEILDAVREFIEEETEKSNAKFEKEVKELHDKFVESDLYKNINPLKLYNVELKFDGYYGRTHTNELMTGVELLDDSRAINAEEITINNTDMYNISVRQNLVDTDERLISAYDEVFVTGLTLKEKLLTGLQSHGNIKPANDRELIMLKELGQEIKTVQILGSKMSRYQERVMSSRFANEIKRAENNVGDPFPKVEYTKEGNELKYAFFSSKVFSMEEVSNLKMASYQRYIVAEKITVTKEQFEKFSKSFDMVDLNSEFKGGSNSTFEIERDVKDYFELTEEEQGKYIAGSYNLALQVFVEGEEFSLIIDPQGYDYARYIGIIGNYSNTTNKDDLKNKNEVIESNTVMVETSQNEIKEETKTNNNDITYKLNDEKKGIEIYFTDKPSEEVRNELKANKFRWSRFNKCWYAKQTDDTIALAERLAGGNIDNNASNSEPIQYEEIDINDLDNYVVPEHLSKSENDAHWIFRQKERDHNSIVQETLKEMQKEAIDVISILNNDYYIYRVKTLLQSSKKKYFDAYISWLNAKVNCPSWAVTGRAGRSASKYEKGMSRIEKWEREKWGIIENFNDKLKYYQNKEAKDHENKTKREIKQAMKNVDVDSIKFTTKRIEINDRLYSKHGAYQCYVAENYFICKAWGCFRIFDLTTQKEIHSMKTAEKLTDAKRYVAYLINKDQSTVEPLEVEEAPEQVEELINNEPITQVEPATEQKENSNVIDFASIKKNAKENAVNASKNNDPNSIVDFVTLKQAKEEEKELDEQKAYLLNNILPYLTDEDKASLLSMGNDLKAFTKEMNSIAMRIEFEKALSKN